jgi:hypothetical protein
MRQIENSRFRLAAVAVALVACCGCAELPATPGSNSMASPAFVQVKSQRNAGSTAAQAPITVSGKFNASAIPAGRAIWFNSVLDYSGTSSLPVTFNLTQGSIQFVANGTTYVVPVPNATIVFSPTAMLARTDYDPATQTWVTTVPMNAAGNVFASGVAWTAPVDLPGGIQPVTWQGQFSTDTPGTSLKWRWSAAAYNNLGSYLNSDHAGTPESFKKFVAAGATGGGGSNYTGGLTGDLVVVPVPAGSGPLNGSAQISADKGGVVTVGRFTLNIPPHALRQNATIGISVSDQSILQCDLSISPASANGFSIPVTLSSDFSGGNVVDPTALVEVWFDSAAGVWREVPGSGVDVANAKVTAPLSHFSSYGVANGGKAGW